MPVSFREPATSPGRASAGDPHDQLASIPVEIVIEWNAQIPALD